MRFLLDLVMVQEGNDVGTDFNIDAIFNRIMKVFHDPVQPVSIIITVTSNAIFKKFVLP